MIHKCASVICVCRLSTHSTALKHRWSACQLNAVCTRCCYQPEGRRSECFWCAV